MIALLLLALTDFVDLWPPRGTQPISCTKSCAWEGGAFPTRCAPALECVSPPWRHRYGAGQTFASLSVCYRPADGGPFATEWCEYAHGVIDLGFPIVVRLTPPDPTIFRDGFESGLAAWSRVEM